ncbi:GTP cyclohydrolase II [Aquabacterium sp.]|uniref:GTP cyclohydrolase II n=1 Tax=Aquabacterium sp. TaxID=1872578 RepID=UPI0025BDDFDD|nr:GTP cyclohydrolase II [Aquabacterium sp.]
MSSPDTALPPAAEQPAEPLTPVAHALVEFLAEARVPTEHGSFTMKLFREKATGLEHVAMVMGDVRGSALVRVHSECMTGDVFGSLRCDCGPQLHFAMNEIGKRGSGVVVYLRQEGRGIGLANKLRAYQLQDQGMDTVEANQHLGFAADLRKFDAAVEILSALGISSVKLMTNNPRKVDTLREHGVAVEERVPVRSDVQPENERYLDTKARKLGHHIDWLG